MNAIRHLSFQKSLQSSFVVLIANRNLEILSARMNESSIEFYCPAERMQTFFQNADLIYSAMEKTLAQGSSIFLQFSEDFTDRPIQCLIYPENSISLSLVCFTSFSLSWLESASLIEDLADDIILLDGDQKIVGAITTTDFESLFLKQPIESGHYLNSLLNDRIAPEINKIMNSSTSPSAFFDYFHPETNRYFHINKMHLPQGILLLFSDITSTRQKQKTAYEQETLVTIKELAGAIAHEFSQPVQALKSLIFFLENEPGKKEYIQMAKANIERISELSKRLLSLKQLKRKTYLDSFIIDLKASADIPKDNMRKHILIAEDELEILETFKRFCEHLGYYVFAAENGEEASRILQSHSVELVISDIDMPKMDGFSLFEFWKQQQFPGQFIFLTGYAISDKKKDLVAEADGLLYKPIELAELETSIYSLIGKP